MSDAGAMGMEDEAMSRHLVLTPHWEERPGDRTRADSIVVVARSSLVQYRDVAVAEADGYRMFAPKVKRQRVYHYTKAANALKARWIFDATEPTALLYRRDRMGQLVLIGAMYTAPASMSLEELDQRIPLSIARWHQHTSICLPPGSRQLGDAGDMGMTGPDPRFGPRGSISTKEECDAAGGTFRRRMFAWMVHVNAFGPPDQVWDH